MVTDGLSIFWSGEQDEKPLEVEANSQQYGRVISKGSR